MPRKHKLIKFKYNEEILYLKKRVAHPYPLFYNIKIYREVEKNRVRFSLKRLKFYRKKVKVLVSIGAFDTMLGTNIKEVIHSIMDNLK